MAYSENAFAMASRNTPVRDELVLSLDDIFPTLKSADGIPVVKHTKRGQSEDRRLRLDTDVSTLEVFRMSSSYLNRKMLTRAYNLSLLDEVGPATSVPGGLPATPGRTLMFVFRNRKLYVTVSSREICAALVALFRPAGGPASHASPRSGGNAIPSGDDSDAFGRRRSGSSASPYSRSVSNPRGGRSIIGRVSDPVISRSQGNYPSMGISAREFRVLGGVTKRDVDCSEGENVNNGGSGGKAMAQRGVLTRPASYSEGLDAFRVDGASTSSSEEEIVVSTPEEAQSKHQPPETPPRLESRSGFSPESAYSSESPEAVMRSRVVGFGSEDLGVDAKPRSQSKVSSKKGPWARFTDSDKRITMTAAAGPRARGTTVALAVEDKASVADVEGQSVGTSTASGETGCSSDIRAVSAPVASRERDNASPLAVRFEDRLDMESLRRPASAFTGNRAPAGRQSDLKVSVLEPRPSKMPNSKLLLQKTQDDKKAKSPPMRRPEGAAERNTLTIASKHAPSTMPPGQMIEHTVVSHRLDLSTDAREGRKLATRDKKPTEWKIPTKPRHLLDVQKQQQQQELEAKKGDKALEFAPLLHGREREIDKTPLTSNHGHENRTLMEWERQEIVPSASIDSLEIEEMYEIQAEENESVLDPTDGGERDGARGRKMAVNQARSSPLPWYVGEPRPRLKSMPMPMPMPTSAPTPTPTPRSRVTPTGSKKADGSSRDKSCVSTSLGMRVVTLEAVRADAADAVEEINTTTTVAMDMRSNGITPRENGQVAEVERVDSFETPTLDADVHGLTIEAAPSVEFLPPSAGTVSQPDVPPFSTATPSVMDARCREDFRGSPYHRRTSTATDCTSPDSPPGGPVGEVRATPFQPAPRQNPLMTRLSLNGPQREQREGPSGFEELWAVLEPGWGMNSSFGTSMTPNVMLLYATYQKMRSLQAAVSRVCVRACGPVLGVVCGRCGRAWAVLSSTSLQSLAESRVPDKIEKALGQLIATLERYEVSNVVRRLTLPLIGEHSAWEEMLLSGEESDLHGPCQQIEAAIALLLDDDRGKDRSDSGDSGGRGGGSGVRQSLFGGGNSKGGRRKSGTSDDLRLPRCPTLWAKGQFDRLTPLGLADVMTLMHEPARFAELAWLVIRASDDGPKDGASVRSPAWDCVRMAEGPALGRELRRALAATLVAAGELLPLPRVPPPPPAYVPRDRLSEQVEATILHPFLPLGIAGIGGPSGSGKTVLASAVVRDATVRSRFGDRVFWLHAGKGARNRLISILQTLADMVYAWLTEGEHITLNGCGRGGSGRRVGQVGGGEVKTDPELREPVRFRDKDQALNYVADMCRGPSLAGLRCLVVLDDVHERDVVDTIWRSGCQLLITSPDHGLLQAIGAEATIAQPLDTDDARKVVAGAGAENMLCEEADTVLSLCRGCPLALAISGAVAQAMRTGSDTREWRRPRFGTPRSITSAGDGAETNGVVAGNVAGPISIGSGWSLGNVGAWVEQVVVGSTSLPMKRVQQGDAPSRQERGAGGRTQRQGKGQGMASSMSREGMSATKTVGSQKSAEATAWISLAARIERERIALQNNPELRRMLFEAGPECELATREVIVALTRVALEEADRILGSSRLGTDCFLSFALLPEGLPLPPPALEEFWLDEDAGTTGSKSSVSGIMAASRSDSSAFAEVPRAPEPIEVFEALRLLGRAGGSEGADGLIPHGIQRLLVVGLASLHPEKMDRMAHRRARMLSRISSLVGTFEDDCWALGGGGGEEARIRRAAAASSSSASAMVSSNRYRDDLAGSSRGKEEGNSQEVELEPIPTGLLGSGRPGRPSHGFGGFSRYDYLVASWDALPVPHTLSVAAGRYLESVRASCKPAATAMATQTSRRGGGASWAEARALASAADVNALAGRREEAIGAYVEACELLAAEAERCARSGGGVNCWQQSARGALHKVASMVQDLAVVTAQLGKMPPAIRLLQRAVEIHLSVLEASGALVPDFGGDNGSGTSPGQESRLNNLAATRGSVGEGTAGGADGGRGRGGAITCRAVAEDCRPLPLRLWSHPAPIATAGQQSPSGRGSSCGGGGGGGMLPAYGRLDVVGTCVGDLGLVVVCTRQLRQEERVEESVQLAEKAYPVLREILGADHAFTRAALAAFVGQGIVDECWSQSDVVNGALGQPSLPSPTSRRRLARNYEGRSASAMVTRVSARSNIGVGVGNINGGSGSGVSDSRLGSSVSASTLSELSSPPSPLPEEFYCRHSFSAAYGGETRTLLSRVTDGASRHRDRDRDRERSSSGLSNNDSTSSGTDGDDDSDAGNAWSRTIASRRAGPVGRTGRLSFQRKPLDRLSNGSRVEAMGQSWRRDSSGGGGGGGLRRGSIEPASSRMQQEFYFLHRTRRARAHAFLITTATRARLKYADRVEAGLYLIDYARQAGAATGGVTVKGAGVTGIAGGISSPEETAQMARLRD